MARGRAPAPAKHGWEDGYGFSTRTVAQPTLDVYARLLDGEDAPALDLGVVLPERIRLGALCGVEPKQGGVDSVRPIG